MFAMFAMFAKVLVFSVSLSNASLVFPQERKLASPSMMLVNCEHQLLLCRLFNLPNCEERYERCKRLLSDTPPYSPTTQDRCVE